jgi:signal transduction histidine kinase
MISRNLYRLDMVLFYVNYSHRIQNLSVKLQQSLIEYLIEVEPVLPIDELAQSVTEIDALMVDNRYLSANTRHNLQTLNQLLTNIDSLTKIEQNNRLMRALKIMNDTLEHEALQREKLLSEISRDTETELSVASVTLALILLFTLLFLKRQILQPLTDLQRLLQRLTEGNFTPFTTEHLDPLLLPVFNSYNEMVIHLADLEQAQQLHAQSLQQEVRLATQALLEQQHTLARTERLAAIGEVAAELAHEIRNPLAGIQMAFSNFRREINDPEQLDRLNMINAELKRLTLLLNNMLDQSRHTPELAVDFELIHLIQDLISLTRYQLAENISLSIETHQPIQLHLPESMLRQVLLNLILNAAQALEGQSGIIDLKVAETEQGVSIQVIDNGNGFPQELLDYGIRPFRTSHQRGTGLGLAMVQRFVKNIGGQIQLSNQIPQGACVTILLPKACESI